MAELQNPTRTAGRGLTGTKRVHVPNTAKPPQIEAAACDAETRVRDAAACRWLRLKVLNGLRRSEVHTPDSTTLYELHNRPNRARTGTCLCGYSTAQQHFGLLPHLVRAAHDVQACM